MGAELSISLIRANCFAYTFGDPKLMKIVKSMVEGPRILNLFAGKNTVHRLEVRVDSDPEMPNLHFTGTAKKFLNMMKRKLVIFNTIIYDPPWNERKSKEFYGGRHIGKFTRLKDDIVSVLDASGIIISAGYEIDNFGKGRGMKLEEVLVVNPSGEIRPFFITVERKVDLSNLIDEGDE